jgi:hypothetical protein
MRTMSLAFLFGLTLVLLPALASAQATRTWVSGVGDDVNPCSRTAPCKTFAGALSKTAAGGEINALDSGGFGAVTITKAITIDGGSEIAGVLASGGINGVTVNAGPNDVVILRHLDINGTAGAGSTTGLRGVSFTAGKTLIIEDSKISRFSRGIGVALSAAGTLIVHNTEVVGNPGYGIVVHSTSDTHIAKVSLSNVRVSGNSIVGFYAGAGCRASIRDSTIAGNGDAGVSIMHSSAQVQIDHTDVSNNAIGIEGVSGVVRIADAVITGNTTAGLRSTGGSIVSYGNNRINGNPGGDGAPTDTAALQ